MLKKLALFSLLLATLNGCTGLLWSQNGFLAGSRDMVDNQYTTEYRDIGNDDIRAFAMVKPDSQTLPANSLLMMGDNYWYAVDPKKSQELVAALRAPLSQRFQILVSKPNEKAVYSASDSLYLDISKSEDGSMTFGIPALCLKYSVPTELSAAAQQKERNALLQADFKLNQGNTYSTCFYHIHGTIYAKPEKLPAEYQFERSIPVHLYSSSTKIEKDVNGKMVLRNIALTPFTVVGDIVLLPVYMFMLK